MPQRTIHLKLLLGRDQPAQRVRRRLWLTHRLVNEAVAAIERVLLSCRGRPYAGPDGDLITAEQAEQAALAFARGVQRRNGKPDAGTDAEILAALRQFYEALIPSSATDESGRPGRGNAQAAGGFAGPMMDPNSEGFQSIFAKILDPLPPWANDLDIPHTNWQDASARWLDTPEAQALLRASGSPPRWARLYRSGQPWQRAFLEDQAKKRREATGIPALVRRLKDELGLLPMMPPPIGTRVERKAGGLTPWDRLALRLAVAHLLSWESWNHRTAAEHLAVQNRVDRQRATVDAYGSLVAQLRAYESARHEQLKRVALADDQRPFRIGPRSVRGWTQLREAWQEGAQSPQARLDTIARLQTKLRGRFGDPDLFRWLAEEGRENLWRAGDLLPDVASLNALERLLARKKQSAVYTPPDPQAHPRWIQFEPPGGSNLENYAIQLASTGLAATLPVLVESDSGLTQAQETVPLAPSGQFCSPQLEVQRGQRPKVCFTSSGQEYVAQLRSADILFDRQRLESRHLQDLQRGDFGSAWFKLVLDVEAQCPREWLGRNGDVILPLSARHFRTSLVTPSRFEQTLEPGLRVLAVDLGLRSLAACSVFELVARQPNNGLSFLADEPLGLWARHERSFLLTLPGETPESASLAARRTAYDELAGLRRDVQRLKSLLRLTVKPDADQRQVALDELLSSVQQESVGAASALDVALVEALRPCIDANPVDWEQRIREAYRRAEAALGLRIAQWRQRSRPRPRDAADRRQRRAYAGGKSAWAVEYLEAVRRLLLGWSLRGRTYGSINRLDRQRRGTFARHLLDHVNALKEDRVKSGADLIVQAARGLVAGPRGGWTQRFAPCRLILFEDLTRYRFRTDRPRRENSMLMRWCHRKLLDLTTAQAEVFGLAVDTTAAGFSSRFHAATGAPGCRTRVLSAHDLTSPYVREQLQELADRLAIPLERFRPGVRIPWDGGEEFCTLAQDGRPLVLHADINAAQTLQRRYWTRHRDAFRVSAVEVSEAGRTVWYPDSEGVRLRGGLAVLAGGAGYARLVPAADGDGFSLEPVAVRQWRRAVGRQAAPPDDAQFDEIEAEILDAVGDLEPRAGRAVFFRDPSSRVLRSDRWYETKVFWGRVQRAVAHSLALTGPMAAARVDAPRDAAIL